MKKNKVTIFALIAIIIVGAVFALAGCTGGNENEPDKLLVVAPDGAPAYSMAQIFSEKPQFDGVEIEYRVVAQSALQGLITTGEADIAILPTNLGANLYNKGEDVKLVGATSFGLNYIVSRDPSVKTVEDLANKTVHCIGQGNVPDFILQFVLQKKAVKNVNIVYAADGTDVMNGLLAETVQIGVLAEPAATGAIGKLKQAGVSANRIDLQAAWTEITGKDSYPQSSLFTRSAVAIGHPEVVSVLTEKMIGCNAWLADNFDAANAALLAAGGTTRLPSVGIIPQINVGFVSAKDGKEAMIEYFTNILNFKAAFIGGKLPDDGFYL